MLMLMWFIDRAVCDNFLPTAAWSMREAWLEFRNYSFTLRVPPSGQSADLSQAQFAGICIISAFLPFFFPHTQKKSQRCESPHESTQFTSTMRLTPRRITAQPNVSYVSWDARLQDVILTAQPVSSGYGFVDFDSPAAAQKAVTALKSTGIQAQMAKVRIHCRTILISSPLRWPFPIKVPNCGCYLPNSSRCWPCCLSVGCRVI